MKISNIYLLLKTTRNKTTKCVLRKSCKSTARVKKKNNRTPDWTAASSEQIIELIERPTFECMRLFFILIRSFHLRHI